MPRKVRQLLFVQYGVHPQEGTPMGIYYYVCEDGTVWSKMDALERKEEFWEQIEDLPPTDYEIEHNLK